MKQAAPIPDICSANLIVNRKAYSINETYHNTALNVSPILHENINSAPTIDSNVEKQDVTAQQATDQNEYIAYNDWYWIRFVKMYLRFY